MTSKRRYFKKNNDDSTAKVQLHHLSERLAVLRQI